MDSSRKSILVWNSHNQNSPATLDVDVQPVIFQTNRGPIRINVWDINGGYCDRRDHFLQGLHWLLIFQLTGQCCIMMFDTTSRNTYKNVPTWYRQLTCACENIPTVMCGNKVDVKERKVKPKSITFHRKKNLQVTSIPTSYFQYYDISVKSGFNCEKPFLWIIRKLVGDHELQFIEPTLIRKDWSLKDIEYLIQYRYLNLWTLSYELSVWSCLMTSDINPVCPHELRSPKYLDRESWIHFVNICQLHCMIS